MAGTFDVLRAETRAALKVFVELHSFDNAVFEITYTIDVSRSGARVLSKTAWKPNQSVSVRMIRGELSARARVVHCQPSGERTFAVGLEFPEPVRNWPSEISHWRWPGGIARRTTAP